MINKNDDSKNNSRALAENQLLNLSEGRRYAVLHSDHMLISAHKNCNFLASWQGRCYVLPMIGASHFMFNPRGWWMWDW